MPTLASPRTIQSFETQLFQDMEAVGIVQRLGPDAYRLSGDALRVHMGLPPKPALDRALRSAKGPLWEAGVALLAELAIGYGRAESRRATIDRFDSVRPFVVEFLVDVHEVRGRADRHRRTRPEHALERALAVAIERGVVIAGLEVSSTAYDGMRSLAGLLHLRLPPHQLLRIELQLDPRASDAPGPVLHALAHRELGRLEEATDRFNRSSVRVPFGTPGWRPPGDPACDAGYALMSRIVAENSGRFLDVSAIVAALRNRRADDESPDAEALLHSFATVAIAALREDPASSIPAWTLALERATRFGDIRLRSEIMTSLADATRASGERVRAEHLAREALEFATAWRDDHGAAEASFTLGRCRLDGGDLAGAEPLLEQLVRWQRAVGHVQAGQLAAWVASALRSRGSRGQSDSERAPKPAGKKPARKKAAKKKSAKKTRALRK